MERRKGEDKRKNMEMPTDECEPSDKEGSRLFDSYGLSEVREAREHEERGELRAQLPSSRLMSAEHWSKGGIISMCKNGFDYASRLSDIERLLNGTIVAQRIISIPKPKTAESRSSRSESRVNIARVEGEEKESRGEL
uniref:Uncharacterized protein n=1 Tax=Pristionchus pacificus TaxID=54126 RepID=A0A2A6BQA1_PRIPA|eukprot:PDM68094.1 hypothetical protein PRIPAC_46138 [Pristionchus pacificus]